MASYIWRFFGNSAIFLPVTILPVIIKRTKGRTKRQRVESNACKRAKQTIISLWRNISKISNSAFYANFSRRPFTLAMLSGNFSTCLFGFQENIVNSNCLITSKWKYSITWNQMKVGILQVTEHNMSNISNRVINGIEYIFINVI